MKTFLTAVCVVSAIAASPSLATVISLQDFENGAGGWTFTPGGTAVSGGVDFGAAGLGNGPSAPGSKVFSDMSTFAAVPGMHVLAQNGFTFGTWPTGTTFQLKFDYKGGTNSGDWVSPRIMYYSSTSNNFVFNSFGIYPSSQWQTFTGMVTYTAAANIIAVYPQLLIYTGGDPATINDYALDNIELSVVPEPMTVGLLALGGLVLRRRTLRVLC